MGEPVAGAGEIEVAPTGLLEQRVPEDPAKRLDGIDHRRSPGRAGQRRGPFEQRQSAVRRGDVEQAVELGFVAERRDHVPAQLRRAGSDLLQGDPAEQADRARQHQGRRPAPGQQLGAGGERLERDAGQGAGPRQR